MGDFPSLLIMLLLQKRKASFHLFRVLSFQKERPGNEREKACWGVVRKLEVGEGTILKLIMIWVMLSPCWAWSGQHYDLGFFVLFFPFKPQSSSIALSCPRSSTNVPLSVWNTLLFPFSLSPSTLHLFFTSFIFLTIAWSKKPSMISKPGWWPQKNSMASWNYHITASVTLFRNYLFSCLQTLC